MPSDLHIHRIDGCLLGEGSYGKVITAWDEERNEAVAIKLCDVFNNRKRNPMRHAKKFLREIRVLAHCSHLHAPHCKGIKNIVHFIDIDVPRDLQNFSVLHVVTNRMLFDLSRVLKSKFKLTPSHNQYFSFQLIRGMNFLHAADILHRDVKPSNLLLDADSRLNICDFGLARGQPSQPEMPPEKLTSYVVTRWYRAPEILLEACYSKAADVWAVGLILLEMFTRRPVLRGENKLHQLELSLQLTGTPSEDQLPQDCNSDLVEQMFSWQRYPPTNLAKLVENAPMAVPVEVLDLAGRMLRFDPRERITMEDALAHPYFRDMFCAEKDLVAPEDAVLFDDFFERIDPTERNMRALFLEEIAYFHPEIVDKLVLDYVDGKVMNFNEQLFPSFLQGLQRFEQSGGESPSEMDLS